MFYTLRFYKLYRWSFVILWLFYAEISYAQVTFQKKYGTTQVEQARGFQQTYDKGYILTGVINPGNYDAFLLKTDSLGDTMWVKTFDKNHDLEQGYGVIQTNDSGYILVGFHGTFGNTSFMAIRADKNGDTLWTRVLPQFGLAIDVCETFDNGFIFAGNVGNTVLNIVDGYIVKLDSTGQVLWSKILSNTRSLSINSICLTTDSGYIIGGKIDNFGTGQGDVFIAKFDRNGNKIWSKAYGDNLNNYCISIVPTFDRNFIAGVFSETATTYVNRIQLYKIDPAGNFIWSKSFTGRIGAAGKFIKQCSDSGFIITGGGNVDDIFLIKTNSVGDTLWTHLYGQLNLQGGYGVTQTTDGGYAICGMYNINDSLYYDICLIKTDSVGNVGCYESGFSVIVSTDSVITSNANISIISGLTTSIAYRPVINGHDYFHETNVCPPLAVEELTNILKVTVYPSPAHELLNINFEEPVKAKISLWDAAGRLMIIDRIHSTREHVMNIENLAGGLYLLKIETAESVYNKTVIIQ